MKPMTPYIYTPKHCVDLGFLGEHPIELTAWIREELEAGSMRRSVNIVRAVITVLMGELAQEINVTSMLAEDNYARRDWEEEIYKDWKSKRDREFEMEGA